MSHFIWRSVFLIAVLCAAGAPRAASADEKGSCCSPSMPRPSNGNAVIGMTTEDLAKLGKVEFPISCNAEAQKTFTTAIAMLHSFWYDEADCAFTRVLDVDPTCAMGHWGIAMSLYHPLWTNPSGTELARGRAALKRARELGGKTTSERAYIEALGSFFDNSVAQPHAQRAKAYELAMQRLHETFPEDREAAAFYALLLMAGADPKDKTLGAQIRAGEIAEQIMGAQPNHPGAAHYVVHAYDYPALAPRALNAARRYAKIAPSAPHALHMPSHTFSQLGLWRESIGSNTAAAAAARRYAAEMKMDGNWEEELHSLDYLIYADLQLGRDADAARVLKELRAVRKTTPERSRKSAYALEAGPARYALERRRWQEAAALEPHQSAFPRASALTHFARGYARARLGDVAGAQRDLDELIEARSRLEAHSDEGGSAAALVDVQRLAVAAWLEHARGRQDEAIRLMRQSAALEEATDDGPVTPGPLVRAQELLGELLLELEKPKEALLELEASAATVPHRLNVTLAIARAKRALGRVSEARALVRQIESLCAERGCAKEFGERPAEAAR